MPSYLAVQRIAVPEQLSLLVTLAESLLAGSIFDDVIIRNIALVPRLGRLYLHVDAPAPTLVSAFLSARSPAPVSVAEAERVEWGRLISPLPRHPAAASERDGDLWLAQVASAG